MRKPKPKANLYLRFRMPDGKQSAYCPVLYDSKSRIRVVRCGTTQIADMYDVLALSPIGVTGKRQRTRGALTN